MKKFILSIVTILTGLVIIYGVHFLVKNTASTPFWKAPTVTEAPTFDDLLDAIEWVESKGISDAVGDGGNAVGSYQIWKIYVDDVNRILNNKNLTYSYEDRLDIDKSRTMTTIYITHYAQPAAREYLKLYIGTMEPINGLDVPMFEIMARCHNGGPDGWKKESTKAYWAKIKARLAK